MIFMDFSRQNFIASPPFFRYNTIAGFPCGVWQEGWYLKNRYPYLGKSELAGSKMPAWQDFRTLEADYPLWNTGFFKLPTIGIAEVTSSKKRSVLTDLFCLIFLIVDYADFVFALLSTFKIINLSREMLQLSHRDFLQQLRWRFDGDK